MLLNDHGGLGRISGRIVTIFAVLIMSSTAFSILLTGSVTAVTDSDGDGVPDSEDVDPYTKLAVTVNVLWARGLDHFHHEILPPWNPLPPHFWCVMGIQGSSSAYSTVQTPTSWSEPVRPTDPSWSFTRYVDNRVPQLSVTITLYENNGGTPNPATDVLCDIVAPNTVFALTVTYNLRTASWSGSDSYYDGNGYGLVSGDEDGPSTDNVDAELCFWITQNDDADRDGLTYYQDMNGFVAEGKYYAPTNNPTAPNKYDFDGDGLDSDYEYSVTQTSPIRADSDRDGIWDNYEAGHPYLDPRIHADAQGFLEKVKTGLETIPSALLDLSIWMNHDVMYYLLGNMMETARDQFLDLEPARDEASFDLATYYMDEQVGFIDPYPGLNYQIAWALLKFVEAVYTFRFAATYGCNLNLVDVTQYNPGSPYYYYTVGYIGQVDVGEKHLNSIDSSYHPSTVLASPQWTGYSCMPGGGSTLYNYYASQVNILNHMLGNPANAGDLNGDGVSDFEDFLICQKTQIRPILTEGGGGSGPVYSITRYAKMNGDTVLTREQISGTGYRLEDSLLEFAEGVDHSFCRENPSNPTADPNANWNWVYRYIGSDLGFGPNLDSDTKVYEAAADICGIIYFGLNYLKFLRESGENILSYDLDRAAPVVAVSINNGAQYTKSTSVTVQVSASDVLSPVSYIRFSNDGVWDNVAWSSFYSSRTWTVPTGDGPKCVYVQVKDSAGNIAEKSQTIVLETSAPTMTSFQIEGGATYTSNTVWALTIQASDANSGMSQMRFSETGNVVWGPWEPFSTSKQYALQSTTQGMHSLWVQVSDHAGNTAEAVGHITLQGAVKVAMYYGNEATNDPHITLSITTSGWGSPLQMRLREYYPPQDGTITPWTDWMAFHTVYPLTLPQIEGGFLIFVQVKNSQGQMSSGYDCASIYYDVSTYLCPVAINHYKYWDPNPTYVRSPDVYLHVAIGDADDEAVVRIWNENQAPPSSWLPYEYDYSGLGLGTNYTWTLSAGDGLKTVNVQYKDWAGNYATIKQASTTLDTVAPALTTVSIDGGATYATTSSAQLAISATDATSGMGSMHFRNEAGTWSAWEPFSSPKTWALSQGDGYKVVYVEVTDKAGNVASAQDSICLDTATPVVSLVINNGDKYTMDATLGLLITVTELGSGTTSLRISNDGTWNTEEWVPFVHTVSWTSEPGDGLKTVYVQVKDAYGRVSETGSDDIIVATLSPVPGILINDGEQYTTSPDVLLDVSCDSPGSSPVTMMRISDDGMAWSAWESYSPTRDWTLPGADGSKRVYVELMNADGHVSASICDEIVLDTVVPDCAVGVVNSQPWQLFYQVSPYPGQGWSWNWRTFETPYGKAYHVDSQGNGGNGVGCYFYAMGYYPTPIRVPLDGVIHVSGYFLQHDLNPGAPYWRYVSVYILDSGLSSYPIAQRTILDSNFARDTWYYRSCSISGLDPGSTVYVGVGRYDDTNANLMLTAEWASISISDSNNVVYNPGQNPVTLSIHASDALSGIDQMRISDDGVWDTEQWRPVSNVLQWNVPAGEVATTFDLQLRDVARNIVTSSASVCFDTVAPSISMTIKESLYGWISSPSVTALVSATDTTSNLGMMRIEEYGRDWGPWQAVSSEKSLTLLNYDGWHGIVLQVMDRAGNLATTPVVEVTLSSALAGCSLEINGGDAYTTSQSVLLTAPGPALWQWRFSNDGIAWGEWDVYSPQKAWTLPAGDGVKTVYAQVETTAGQFTTVSDSIVVDTTAPLVSFYVDQYYTSSTAVTFSITAFDDASGPAQMRFSNDQVTWSSWGAYATSGSWTLLPGDGAKIVYAQVSDGAGNVATAHDSAIVLDTVVDSCRITINNGDEYTKSATVSLTLSAYDATSGIKHVRYSGDRLVWTKWWDYSTTLPWTFTSGEGTRTIYYEVADQAGNSLTSSDTIILDTVAPVTGSSVSGQTVTLTAADPTSGVQTTYYRIDGNPVPQVYTSPISLGSGTHTVEFWSVDKTGNVELSKFIQAGTSTVQLTVNAGYFGAKGVWVPLSGTVTVDASSDTTGHAFPVSTGSHTVKVQDQIVASRKTYYFQEWQGFASSTNPGTFSITADKTLVAVFSTTARYTLEVQVNDAAWGYTSPTGVQPPVTAGSMVQVTAFPRSGYQFGYWLLDGVKVNGNPYTVTMNSNHVLKAVFEPAGTPHSYTVKVSSVYLSTTWKPINTGTVTIGTQTVGMNQGLSLYGGSYGVTFPATYKAAGKTYVFSYFEIIRGGVASGHYSNSASITVDADMTLKAYYTL